MGTLAEMLSTPLGVIEWFVYLLAAVMFVIGLHLMNSPKTARHRPSSWGPILPTGCSEHLQSASMVLVNACAAASSGLLPGIPASRDPCMPTHRVSRASADCSRWTGYEVDELIAHMLQSSEEGRALTIHWKV